MGSFIYRVVLSAQTVSKRLLGNENFLEREQLLRVHVRRSGKVSPALRCGPICRFSRQTNRKRSALSRHQSAFLRRSTNAFVFSSDTTNLSMVKTSPALMRSLSAFLKSETANRLCNFLRIIARLRAENDAAAAPNRRRFVTGAGATCSFLPPWLCAGQIHFGFGLRVGGAGTPRRAHRHDHIVHGLRTATVLDQVDLRFFRCGFS